MQQIADWLEKLGMSEYAQRFAENKIDVSVLRHLTDQDLKDIGVLARASPRCCASATWIRLGRSERRHWQRRAFFRERSHWLTLCRGLPMPRLSLCGIRRWNFVRT